MIGPTAIPRKSESELMLSASPTRPRGARSASTANPATKKNASATLLHVRPIFASLPSGSRAGRAARAHPDGARLSTRTSALGSQSHQWA